MRNQLFLDSIGKVVLVICILFIFLYLYFQPKADEDDAVRILQSEFLSIIRAKNAVTNANIPGQITALSKHLQKYHSRNK